jgi:hypothetical protein
MSIGIKEYLLEKNYEKLSPKSKNQEDNIIKQAKEKSLENWNISRPDQLVKKISEKRFCELPTISEER